jgi:hypothetical protein
MVRSTLVALAAVALGAAAAPAASPYDDLLKHASSNTNALVLIDLKQAYSSPLARREQWAEKVGARGHGGLGFFPADSELVAVAAEVNLTTMVREHQIGLVRVKSLPNFNGLAAREGGNTDDLAGHLTVFSPRNVYFTSFSGGTLAAVYPADRQFVSRWLKADKAGKLPPLPPHLKAAAEGAKDDTVTIALDVEDSVDPGVLKFGLAVSPVMARHKGVNQQALAVFLSRAKGLTFSARVTDGVAGKVAVEFADDPRRYKGVLKDLFLELVDAYGIYVPGLDRWEAAFTEKAMTLSGPMAADDLRRVVSLFAFPQPESQSQQPPGAGADGPNAAATKRYFGAVAAILGDLKGTRDSSDYYKTATWHDKAALQLEQLSRRNVDPVAVDVAYQAARRLRAIAGSLRGVPIDVEAISSKAYVLAQRVPYYGWGPHWGGWWGGYRWLAFAPTHLQTNVPQVQGEVAKVIADDQKRRIATWTQIDQLLSDARRKLMDKYKGEF